MLSFIKNAGLILLAVAAAVVIAYIVYVVFWLIIYALILGAIAATAWLIYKLIS